ncbi:MAG: hypothetical protein ACRDSK_00085 [Actinophytocola sp.]|uniref:hypothetical protein n=1 Tax=Actinophytocola sp. TaxID=1872138 RepID=UPI003D6B640F
MADLVKGAFAREFDALLNGSRLSTARITLLAREHGIGYSTLRSWRTGVHLPRVPEDNPAFRAFLQSVADDHGHAAQVFDLARRAWRAAQQAKHQVGRVRPMLTTQVPPGLAELLDGQARWLLVLLAANRCRALSEDAVSALAGLSLGRCRSLLGELTTLGCVVEQTGRRFAVPDAVRMSSATASAADIRSADIRLAEYYARTMMAAARRLFPEMLELVAARGSARFGSDQAASDWLAAERDNSVVAAEAVAEHDPAQAVRVADALRAAQQVRPFAVDWTPVAEAARRGADGNTQLAAMEYATGLALWGRGELASAASVFASAGRRWRAMKRPREQAAILHMLGAAKHAAGHWAEAKANSAGALRLRRQLGEPRAEASTLIYLADACLGLSEFDAAEAHAGRAADLSTRTGYSAGSAGALGSLGRALLGQGRDQQAELAFIEQQAVSGGVTFDSRTAIALLGRATVCMYRHHYDAAIDFAEQAADYAHRSANSAVEVDAYTLTAQAHRARGRHVHAEALQRHAQRIAEASGRN